MLYRFLEQIIVPSVNYGAFIDDSSAKTTYNLIDEEIAGYLRGLFSELPNIKEMRDTSTKKGGF